MEINPFTLLTNSFSIFSNGVEVLKNLQASHVEVNCDYSSDLIFYTFEIISHSQNMEYFYELSSEGFIRSNNTSLVSILGVSCPVCIDSYEVNQQNISTLHYSSDGVSDMVIPVEREIIIHGHINNIDFMRLELPYNKEEKIEEPITDRFDILDL